MSQVLVTFGDFTAKTDIYLSSQAQDSISIKTTNKGLLPGTHETHVDPYTKDLLVQYLQHLTDLPHLSDWFRIRGPISPVELLD